MIDKLVERHGKKSEIGKELSSKSASIKAAALLHDIGHGPFSHLFERVFKREDGIIPSHEGRSCQILRHRDTEVGQVLRKINKRDDGVSVNVRLVCSLISSEEDPPPDPYLKDIVSSQLDADRMDYLLRDSLMTGSRYGQFDSEWILNALTIRDLGLGTPSVKKLCLDQSKSIGAIEGMLFARLLMYHYVYGHKKIRAYGAELIQTLRLALLLKDVLPPDTPEPVRNLLVREGDVPVKDYLLLDDEVLWWALRRWAVWENLPEVKGDLAGALKRHALRVVRRHKPWCTVVLENGKSIAAAGNLIQDLGEDPLRFECYVDNLADLPYKPYGHMRREGRDDMQALHAEISVVNAAGEVVPLSEVRESHIVEALEKDQKLCRFHYDINFSKEFAGLMKKFGVC